jgi:Xaa-Pro aminopeptidase
MKQPLKALIELYTTNRQEDYVLMDFKRRLLGLQRKMEETDLDMVVYGSCQNFQYLTGLLVDWRRGIDLGSKANAVFVARRGEPILTLSEDASERATSTWIKDSRILRKDEDYGGFVRNVISDLDVKGKRIGLGDHVWGSMTTEIKKALKGTDFFEAEDLTDNLRMIKDEEEIGKVRKAAELTDRVMEAVVPKIGKGVTQHELELEVEFQGRRLGASDVSFPPASLFVKSGSEITSNPFVYPREKGLVSNTSVAFDIGFVVDGYCSDFGRSFYYGRAGSEVKKAYEALQQSVLETVDGMADYSMRACDLFPTLESTLDRLGYGGYLRARLPTKNLGHSIGVEVHEPPWLSPEYDESLCKGMVMALEPKLWHAGEYYLRVEDIVLIGQNKTEFLTNFDRELFQLQS